MTKNELQAIIVELINLGEDKDELNYWLDIYDDLSEDKQQIIALNLQNELEKLQENKKRQQII